MKRLLYIFLLLPLAVLTGCSRQESPTESLLYQHYAAQQDLRVAQVNGFKLSDTVRALKSYSGL